MMYPINIFNNSSIVMFDRKLFKPFLSKTTKKWPWFPSLWGTSKQTPQGRILKYKNTDEDLHLIMK